MNIIMTTRIGSKNKKVNSKGANSSSSTTSSSKQYPEVSIDGLSSPASSSMRSKLLHSHSDNIPAEAESSKENVTVTVRFRPLSQREIRQGEEIAWYADGDTIVRNENTPSIAYAYDRVFGPTTTTRHVYDVAAQHAISGAMEGINGTIFAYGVTSSGKTHTMHGDQRSPGIIPLAVKDAFSIIQETPNREFLLRVSYLEIYNEVVNDLLNPAGQNLRIREDAQGTFVEGIKEEVVLSPAHALSLIAAGEEHRHVGSTNFNLLSSRSHTIFTLTIESSLSGENCEGEAVSLSQLNLIDRQVSESLELSTVCLLGSWHFTKAYNSGTPFCHPSSSNSEETHNTLKFAHRAKHIEIQAAQNKIIDEKSLIKKYQNEIRRLKEELEQLKSGIVAVPQTKHGGEDIMILKQKLEDGQVRMQSRLEQEEEAKSALLGRIQRLTKLILVSTKAPQSSRYPHRQGLRRRHSFGEEELAYLPHRRRDLILDDDNIDVYVTADANTETSDDTTKEEKKTKKNGLLDWLKLRKRESGTGALGSTSDKSSGVKSESTTSADHLNEVKHDVEPSEENFLEKESPLTSFKTIDQIDLLREQQKILSGEVALHRSVVKRLSEEAAHGTSKENAQKEIRDLNDEIRRKNEQIASLEKQISNSINTSNGKLDKPEESQLNEKSFELEVKSADNRIIQEQLSQKISECEELKEATITLKQQLSDALDQRHSGPSTSQSEHLSETDSLQGDVKTDKQIAALNNTSETLFRQAKAREIEELTRKVAELTEVKEHLALRNQKLAEESSYAKGLASAAAVELKALSEEVTKLMNQNEKLAADLAAQKNSPAQRRSSSATRNGRRDVQTKRHDQGSLSSDVRRELASNKDRELALSKERELSYEAVLLEKEHREAELQRKVEESKQREAYLENELANMWVLVAKLKGSQGTETENELATENLRIDSFETWNDARLKTYQ
ncbi:hypothetical protein Leryth_001248 [Lithospermum erythrorhizon]|nr:hypothetical protein Leryth_001248 [Lithospermum erythrorhizon]